MKDGKVKGCKDYPTRYVSNGASVQEKCLDVCTEPLCGDPDFLTLFAPVVYDEIGINLCRSISLPPVTLSNNVASITAQVLDVEFDQECDCSVTAGPINGRPNCYLVTLTNLKVTFLITFYDCARRVVDTVTVSAIYLPPESSCDCEYMDVETNPHCLELEIFAPYGITHSACRCDCPHIHCVGFDSCNSTLAQGLNLIAIPKVLKFNAVEDYATIGLTIYLKTIYFSQYKIPHHGKAIVPKACVRSVNDNSVCFDFVSGDLLELDIKPLELGPPKYEECLKVDCENNCRACEEIEE